MEDARSQSSSSCVAPLDQPALPTHCLAHRSLPGLSCPGSLPTTTATTTRGLGEQGGAVEPHCCWLGGGRCGRGFQMPDRTSFHGGTESHQGAPAVWFFQLLLRVEVRRQEVGSWRPGWDSGRQGGRAGPPAASLQQCLWVEPMYWDNIVLKTSVHKYINNVFILFPVPP